MVSLIASIFTDFEPPESLNALFLSLAGAAIALNRTGHHEEDKKTEDKVSEHE